MSLRSELPVDEMVVRYEAGESTPVLGRAYGVSHHTIWRRLVAAGVKMRPCGGPQGNRYGRGNAGHYKRGGPLWVTRDGYLSTYDRGGKQCLIHRGCWEAYHGPIPDGYDVHHPDENRQHNEIKNLACVTHGDHTRLHKEGARHGFA